MTGVDHFTEPDERRRSERYALRGQCRLEAHGVFFDAFLVNISEGGALSAVVDEHIFNAGDAVNLHVDLEDGGHFILAGKVKHLKEHYLGLACAPLDEQSRESFQQLIQKVKTDNLKSLG